MDDRALALATAAASVSVKQPKVRSSMHKGNRSCDIPALLVSVPRTAVIQKDLYSCC